MPLEPNGRLAAVEAALAALAVEVREARYDIKKLDETISGPPRDGSVRDRLHTLENDTAAAKAAAAAVEAIRLAQRRTFGTVEKTVLFGFAALASGSQVAGWFGFG